MKISASIYATKNLSLDEIIDTLEQHEIDLYHIDCNDDAKVFEDIKKIKKKSSIPTDLHLVTPNPAQYFQAIEACEVDYVCFQVEDVKEYVHIPKTLAKHRGIAIHVNSDDALLEPYIQDIDYILVMTTTPGISGGTFDARAFQKIKQYVKKYPTKRIHVDGGVNNEVSFILRILGIDTVISGSYLFKNNSLSAALLQMRSKKVPSHFLLKDFMLQQEELPILTDEHTNLRKVIETMQQFGLGCVFMCDEQHQFKGLVTNADIRRAMLQHTDWNILTLKDCVNKKPLAVQEENTIEEMLETIKTAAFPVLLLPVLNKENRLTGAITFFNLVKGE